MLPLFDTDQQRRMPEDPPYVILHRSGIFEWLTRAKQQGLVNNNSDIFVYYCGDHGTACPILPILLLFCGFHWLESKGKITPEAGQEVTIQPSRQQSCR